MFEKGVRREILPLVHPIGERKEAEGAKPNVKVSVCVCTLASGQPKAIYSFTRKQPNCRLKGVIPSLKLSWGGYGYDGCSTEEKS